MITKNATMIIKMRNVLLLSVLTATPFLGIVAADNLSSALVWASAKDGKAGFELTPRGGKWEQSPRGWLIEGVYDVWNEISFELCAKDDGRFFVGLSVPHDPAKRYPEIAWADISIEGAGEQGNLDFAKGFQFWGANTPVEPRIGTVDGKRAMIVRSDRGKYRGLDLKAGQKVSVRAAFRVMGPAETPKGQHPLDLSAAVNGSVPEGVKLPAAKRDFIGIAIATVDPAAHGGNSCVLFRNGTIRGGAKSVRLAAATVAPCRYLYLLVSSSYTKGPELADVRIAYADGTAETQTLVRKTHLEDWSKTLDSEWCKTVWTALGENGNRSLSLVRLVLDERKPVSEVEVTTAEKANFVLYGATLTSADWKPVRLENIAFRLGGEWRKPDMPSRDIVAGSAIDLSGQMDFAPCGTYGKVIQKGDRLVFEKRPDRPLRFMGNHSSQVWVCDWEPDEKLYCEQMQRTGCNAIRLSIHRLIGDLWFTKEERARKYKMTDGFFVDSRMDNFCRFIAEFNRRGIYLLLASQGNVREIEALMAGEAEARENYRQFMVRTLNYRNPYTGNLIKDEPCVMGWQFANEQSVQHIAHICAFVPNPDAPKSFAASERGVDGYWSRKTREAVAPKWEAFLKRKYGTDWEAHKAYPKRYTEKTEAALDFQIFSQELMDDMMAFYRKVAAEAGWTGLTSWGNYDKILRTTETRVKHGMATEVNNYHSFLADDGHGPQVSSAGDGMSTFRDMAGAAIPGKTVFITEFNDCQHNRYCHEMGLAAGAIASLQGWDAFFLHNSTVLTDLFKPYEYFAINDGLVIANHPSMRASTFLMACLYGRGDAATSPHTVKLDYTKAFMRTLSSTSYPDPQQLRAVMLCRTRVDWPEYGATPDASADLVFPGFGNDSTGTYEFLLAQSSDSKAHTAVLETMVAKMREKGVLGAGNRTDVKKGVYESDTGEILIESAVPRMRIVTARTEALTLPENGAYKADCLEVVRTRNNATFGAVAVDGKPLAESGRIIIVMDGDSAIDGSVKTPDRVRYVDWGPRGKNKRPLQEKIWRTNVAQLRLRNTADGEFTLYPLSVNGIRREPLPVTREGDALVFALDTSAKALPHGITPFFELVNTKTQH